MNLTSSVLFIDQDKAHVDELLGALRDSFPNPFFHTDNLKSLSVGLNSSQIDIVFFDISHDESAMRVFRKLAEADNKITIAVVPEEDSTLKAKVIEFNPFLYITKPYNVHEVRLVLKRALDKIRHSRDTRRQTQAKESFCGIIGKSPKMAALFDLITRIAEDDFSTVLIRGESGTGKELVAKAIHTKSKRRGKNFVPVNCAAIPDDLLESELFGHTRGAFTGATHSKQGRIQYADGGTLFLDEIGDMKPNLQAKLLRVLQEKEFEPVGGLQSTPVDTRILAATHCDLEQLVKEGRFREDLYYRLSVIPLNIPPLKARREDIPLLIESFITTYTTERGRERFDFSRSALQVLLRYNWRGNVRELENLIQHMSILCSGRVIDVQDLPEKYLLAENQTEEDFSVQDEDMLCRSSGESCESWLADLGDFHFSGTQLDFNEMINQFETKLIISALRSTGGNKKEAARLLKLKRTTLLEKIKKKKLTSDSW